MFDDIDWEHLLLVGALFYLGAKTVSAVKTISREVSRFNNYGLADDDDKRAQATLNDSKSTIAQRREASATLRKKVDGAKAAGYGSQVKALETALDLLDRELAAQDELEEKRKAWQAARAAAGAKS
jgi:hypothetical protein